MHKNELFTKEGVCTISAKDFYKHKLYGLYFLRSIFVQLYLGADVFQDKLLLYFLIILPQDKSTKTLDVTVCETK